MAKRPSPSTRTSPAPYKHALSFLALQVKSLLEVYKYGYHFSALLRKFRKYYKMGGGGGGGVKEGVGIFQLSAAYCTTQTSISDHLDFACNLISRPLLFTN